MTASVAINNETAKSDRSAKPAAERSWIASHKYLILRRISQISILGIFLAGPLFGYWIVKGNLTSSLTLGVLPLTDPFVMLQTLVSGHFPEMTALIGAVIVLAFYFLVGGRVYCSWVCPINIISDTAFWLRERFGLSKGWQPKRSSRFWVLAAVMIAAGASGTLAWELVNPVSIIHRGVIFGLAWAAAIPVAIFFAELLIGRHIWCGHLCPMGAFYGLVGSYSPLKMRADKRENCDDCMDCYAVCPEPQVISPALKGTGTPVILSRDCTNCGRCIDVCSEDVFRFGSRFEGERQ